MTFTLPFPPSVNSIWRRDPRTGRTLLSAEARAYHEEAGWVIRQALLTLPGPFPLCGRLAVTLTYHRGDKRSFDLDNHAKILADALQHCGVIVNDQQIDRLLQIRGAVRPGAGCVIVELEELSL